MGVAVAVAVGVGVELDDPGRVPASVAAVVRLDVGVDVRLDPGATVGVGVRVEPVDVAAVGARVTAVDVSPGKPDGVSVDGRSSVGDAGGEAKTTNGVAVEAGAVGICASVESAIGVPSTTSITALSSGVGVVGVHALMSVMMRSVQARKAGRFVRDGRRRILTIIWGISGCTGNVFAGCVANRRHPIGGAHEQQRGLSVGH